MTQVRVYDEMLPESSGNPSGSGNISLYTSPLVTIQLQSGEVELLTGFLDARYDGTELAELPIETAGHKEFISFVYNNKNFRQVNM